jgi:hypothetical protein
MRGGADRRLVLGVHLLERLRAPPRAHVGVPLHQGQAGRAAQFTLMLPTPEPLTMALLGGTLAAAGWVAKQRRVALSSLHADAPTV